MAPTSTPLSKLLIANRGEIAVRIARTAHRMGISTVGIYSDSDATALHVDAVDVAVALGGTTAATSYLRADAVLRAAIDTGCDAVHPGYGFLAENADFAQQVIDAGLAWVGPTPEQIRLLGDKVAAKQAAIAAGVPTTTIIEIDGTGDDAVVPDDVPMPALVKAAAGGGGRGMRIVRSVDELADAVAAASREAASAFGDGTVFIEPYLERGRHVEVQILGDAHGNVIHLGERECSIQRRNQKVVEESPSAGITDGQRATLCEGALALARHVGYTNAGTVEFLVGVDGTVTFLEVNTRLQVEHPVTEAVTGLDLVELQLRVAAGDELPITQDDVRIDGHAIEVRLVAEDPAGGWLPSTGTLARFDISDDVRVDTGVRAGTEVTTDYDSLLAKVIAHAPRRADAARRLARALRSSWIAGVDTDAAALAAILADDDFLAAQTPTSFLDEHPELVSDPGASGDDHLALALGAVFAREHASRHNDPATPFAPSGWRNLRIQGQRQVWHAGDHTEHVEYRMRGRGAADVLVGPWPTPTDDGSLGPDERRTVQIRLFDRTDERQVVEIDGVRHRVDTFSVDDVVHTRSAAGSVSWTLQPRFVDHDLVDAGGGPTSPLPGTVLSVHVAAGDTVSDGDVLVVVEAMKMEHKICAVADATVAEVLFAAGDRVDSGDLLVRLDTGEDAEG